MSVLQLNVRPLVAFDVCNVEHRKYYADFIKNKTWGYCPVRFAIDGLPTDLITQIQRDMVDYYVNKEFKTKKTK